MSPEASPPVAEPGTGAWLDLDGPVFYREWPGASGGPTLVLVHGLGGSGVNWMCVAPALAAHGRVLVPDLAGFGETPLAGRDASVAGNRRLLSRFMQALGVERGVLVGNSMGGAIGLLQAADEPRTVQALVLSDPVLPRTWRLPEARVLVGLTAVALPGLGGIVLRRRAARLTPRQQTEAAFALIAADPTRIPEAVVDAHAELVARHRSGDGAASAFSAATRSILALELRRRRFQDACSRLTCPVGLIHGSADRLVPVAWARAAAKRHPHWTLEVLDGVGHVPMLEMPDRFLAAFERLLPTLVG